MRFLDAAFEDMFDVQFLGDLTQIIGSALVFLSRGARDNLQVSDLREPGQNFVLDAVGEVGVRFFIAQILEGKNRNRLSRDASFPEGVRGAEAAEKKEA